jgi:hypothetical protein
MKKLNSKNVVELKLSAVAIVATTLLSACDGSGQSVSNVSPHLMKAAPRTSQGTASTSRTGAKTVIPTANFAYTCSGTITSGPQDMNTSKSITASGTTVDSNKTTSLLANSSYEIDLVSDQGQITIALVSSADKTNVALVRSQYGAPSINLSANASNLPGNVSNVQANLSCAQSLPAPVAALNIAPGSVQDTWDCSFSINEKDGTIPVAPDNGIVILEGSSNPVTHLYPGSVYQLDLNSDGSSVTITGNYTSLSATGSSSGSPTPTASASPVPAASTIFITTVVDVRATQLDFLGTAPDGTSLAGNCSKETAN